MGASSRAVLRVVVSHRHPTVSLVERGEPRLQAPHHGLGYRVVTVQQSGPRLVCLLRVEREPLTIPSGQTAIVARSGRRSPPSEPGGSCCQIRTRGSAFTSQLGASRCPLNLVLIRRIIID